MIIYEFSEQLLKITPNRYFKKEEETKQIPKQPFSFSFVILSSASSSSFVTETEISFLN